MKKCDAQSPRLATVPMVEPFSDMADMTNHWKKNFDDGKDDATGQGRRDDLRNDVLNENKEERHRNAKLERRKVGEVEVQG